MSNRQTMLRRAAESNQYDLIIIGGGITGCGVAYEAAARGARVLLLERNDFASGTSSRSTKLIHGGIRYLKNADFRLVKEGVQERQALIAAAPHLVHPIQFLYPVHEGDPDPLFMLRLGLVFYDFFAGKQNLLRHRVLSSAGVLQEAPGMRPAGLKGGALYADCITDDARLTVEVARAAARKGAALLNYTEVREFIYDANHRAVGVKTVDRQTGEERVYYAGAILNATGPWADRLRQLDEGGARPILRPTKGVHLTVPHSRLPISRPVVMHGEDKRMMFAVPRDGFTYLGTTDTDYKEDPAVVRANRSDVTYILNAANHMFPDACLKEADVISTWAGLRPLAAASDTAGPSQVSRDYRLVTSPSGVVSVAGGKLTAFQAMAAAIVRKVLPQLAGGHIELELAGAVPVPAAAELAAIGKEYGVSADLVRELWTRHGATAREILTRVSPDAADRRTAVVAAEAAFAVDEEFAVTLTDALHRRAAQLLFSADNGAGAAPAAADAMGALLGWSDTERQAQLDAYRREVATVHAWRKD